LAICWGHGEVVTRIEENVYPRFVGKRGKHPCDFDLEVLVPYRKRRLVGRFCANSVTFLYVLILLALSYHHFEVRSTVTSRGETTLMDLELTIQIKAARALWRQMAPIVTEWEHHQYQHEFDEALVTRIMFVLWGNVLIPFCYAAFVVPLRGQCPGHMGNDAINSGCWDSLGGSITTLMLAEIVMTVNDLLKPVWRYSFNMVTRKEHKAGRKLGVARARVF
jgi:hypothetical protein